MSTRALGVVQGVLIALIAGSLPGGTIAAYSFGSDRNLTGDVVSVLFFSAFVLLLSTPWWRTSTSRTFDQRLTSMCILWFGLTFTTHLTWELGWLVLHPQILAARYEPWAFAWWMYIEGGDLRYATPSPLLLSIESLSVVNGLVGSSALWLRWRSRGQSRAAIFMLMATGVVHIYSALLYLLTEVVAGYPNVDANSAVDLYIKFWLLNGLWIAMPLFVFAWGTRTLRP